MVGRWLAAAALIASAFASPAVDLTSSTFTYNTSDSTQDNTPASNQLLSVPAPPSQQYGGSKGSSYRHGSAWLPQGPRGQSLRPQLPQHLTNGNSPLGTDKAPKLPPWISGDGTPMPQGRPWGGKTCQNTDPYKDPPHTGMTRFYDFHISKQIISPDGVNRSAIVVNGAFPGPTIEANWGDWIQVTVHNDMPDEGTSLHWHGLLQKETQWFDGVPSVQQCPLAPGTSLTYTFRADLYGTSWYHSHYSAQAAGGLFGSMIIHGPHDNADYDEDLGPVLIADWYHNDYYSLVEDTMAPTAEGKLPPVSNNNLINGKMNYPCQSNDTSCTPNAGVAKFKFESGKTYRLRLINAGAEGIQKYSIEFVVSPWRSDVQNQLTQYSNHQMTVIANDFVPVVPYNVDVVTLGVGQRTDIIVKATGKSTDAVWMRSTLGKSAFVGGCNLIDGISPEAVAAIYYQSANVTAIPNTTSSVSDDQINSCQNDDLSKSVPYYSITPDPKPSATKDINITFQSNGTHTLWYMNNSTFRADYNDPVLLEANLGNLDFKPEANVINFGSNESVRIVVYNHVFASAHPMHMHGHNMFILAEGYGIWDGNIVNGHNPQRRDVHLLPNAKDGGNTPSYIVIQLDMDNPGVWPFHCHIAWHVSGGLYVNILENPEQVKKTRIPSTSAQTCRDWWSWTGNHLVDQIDSGL